MAKWEYTQTPLGMVREFATVMGQPIGQKWDAVNNPMESLRFGLIEEEFLEFQEEVDDPAKALKELADLVYVCYGYAATFGWDLDEAVKRVHQSNMSKLGDDGKPIYREDGKVLKSKNYKKPDLSDLV